MAENLPIVEVDYGVASNYGNLIELNKNLKLYPELRKKLIEHERRHSSGRYDKKDFFNDFKSKNSTFFEVLRFCSRNKEGFVNFMPFMYSYYLKEWSFNSTALFPFILYGVIFVTFFYYALSLSFFNLILGWFGAVALLNLIFLIFAHKNVVKNRKIEENKEN